MPLEDEKRTGGRPTDQETVGLLHVSRGAKGYGSIFAALALLLGGSYRLYFYGDAFALINVAGAILVLLFYVVPFFLRGAIILEPRGIRAQGRLYAASELSRVRVIAAEVPSRWLGPRTRLRLDLLGRQGSLLYTRSDPDFTRAQVAQLTEAIRRTYPGLEVTNSAEGGDAP